MLDILWIVMFFLGFLIIFIIADFEYQEYPFYWGTLLTLLDTVIWFLLSASVFETEIPYTMYNATSGNIESALGIVSSKVSPEMSYFCLMMAMAMFVYLLYTMLNIFRELKHQDFEEE